MAENSGETPQTNIKVSKFPDHQKVVDLLNEKAEVAYNESGLTIQGKDSFTPLPPAVTEITNTQSRDLVASQLRGVRREIRLQNDVDKDPLTELPNRRWFEAEAQRAMARTIRTNGVLWLARIDFDRFKSVNDKYGHDVGDLVLKAAQSIQQVSRIEEPLARLGTAKTDNNISENDELARLGGEEFAQIIDENISEEGIANLMYRQMKALEEATREVFKDKEVSEDYIRKYKEQNPNATEEEIAEISRPIEFMTMSYGVTQLKYQNEPFIDDLGNEATKVEIGRDTNNQPIYTYVESYKSFDKRADLAQYRSKTTGKNRGTITQLDDSGKIIYREIPKGA